MNCLTTTLDDLSSVLSSSELSSLLSSVSEMLRFRESSVSSLFDFAFFPALGTGVGMPSARFFEDCENRLAIEPNDCDAPNVCLLWGIVPGRRRDFLNSCNNNL